jgi:NADH-quinone oxidoreductase subunit C
MAEAPPPKDDKTPPATQATPPQAAGDKPASGAPAEPLKGEVSRTDAPGAGASATPVGAPRTEPPAPKPANPTAAQTATTSETSSATGQPTAAASPPPPAAPAAKPAAPAARPAAPAAKPAAAGAHAGGAEHAPKAAPPSGPTDPPPPPDAPVPAYVNSLRAAIPDAVTGLSLYLGDWTIIVPAAQILAVARYLHDAPDAQFDYLSDLTATDWPPRATEGRFDVLYMLYSIRLRHRVRLKVKSGEGQPLSSVTSVWPAANWLEREVYDMFGVNFTGHPDRRRILMPDDWQGFPQRKDYPLEGPGELLMENPIDWLKLRQAKEEAEIE